VASAENALNRANKPLTEAGSRSGEDQDGAPVVRVNERAVDGQATEAAVARVERLLGKEI
jgi:hypothetical protein